TLKNATVKKYYYKSHQQLKEHLYSFVMAYNYAKRLKTLKGLTPYEFICDQWTKFPDLFILPSLFGTVHLESGEKNILYQIFCFAVGLEKNQWLLISFIFS
ncbi:IS3 family transposase, partial [Wolbachia endosymbiont of Pentalonia nigronervosa]